MSISAKLFSACFKAVLLADIERRTAARTGRLLSTPNEDSLSGFGNYGGTAMAVRDLKRWSIRFLWLATNGNKNHIQLAEANWAMYLICLVLRKHCLPLPCLSPHIFWRFWNCPRSGLRNKTQPAKYFIWYHGDAYFHSYSYNIQIICKLDEREAYDCLRLAIYSIAHAWMYCGADTVCSVHSWSLCRADTFKSNAEFVFSH